MLLLDSIGEEVEDDELLQSMSIHFVSSASNQ